MSFQTDVMDDNTVTPLKEHVSLMYTRLTHCAALRRHPRHLARIPVRLFSGQLVLDTVTGDVSLSGAFLRCLPFEDLEEGAAITARFWLPDTLEFVTLEARVTRMVRDEDRSGIGVEFMQRSGVAWPPRWEEFIERLALHLPAQDLAQGALVDYTLRHLTLDALDELAHVDVYIGGLFLDTQAELEPGTRLRLVLVHPLDGSRTSLMARVTRCQRELRRGLCVEFLEPGTMLNARIIRFMEEGMPQLALNEALMARVTRELLAV